MGDAMRNMRRMRGMRNMSFSQRYPTLDAFKADLYNRLYGENSDVSMEDCEDILSNEQTHVQRHIDKTNVQSMDSLLSSPNRQMCGTGSFDSYEIAWDAIRETLSYEIPTVYEWLKETPKDDYTKSKSIDAHVGTEYGQEESLGSGFVKTLDGRIYSYTTPSATVVIVPDASKPLGFAVKTAYPGTNDKENLYNDMTLSTDRVAETIKKTYRYKHAGAKERAYLDYVSHPENHTYGASYTMDGRDSGYASILVPTTTGINKTPAIDRYKLFDDHIEISRTTMPTCYTNRFNDELKIGDCIPQSHPLAEDFPQYATPKPPSNSPISLLMPYDQFQKELGKLPSCKNIVNDVMYMRNLMTGQNPKSSARKKQNERLSQLDSLGIHGSANSRSNNVNKPNGLGE